MKRLLFLFLFSSFTTIHAQHIKDQITTIKQLPKPEIYLKLISLADSLKNTPHQDSLSNIYHLIGVNAHRYNLDTAIFYTQRAIDIRKTTSPLDTNNLSISYYNLGQFYKKQENYQAFHQANKAVINLGNNDANARFYSVLLTTSQFYYDFGDYEKSLNTLKEVIHLPYTKINQKHKKTFSKLYLQYGAIANQIGTKAIAKTSLPLLQLADSIFQSSPYYLAKTYHEIARTYTILENYPLAIDYYTKARDIQLNLNKPILAAKKHNDLGYINNLTGKFNKAENVLQEGLTLLPQKEKKVKASIYHNLGDVYKNKQDFEISLKYYHKAVTLLCPELEKTNIYKSPDIQQLNNSDYIIWLLPHLIQKAKGWLAYYHHTPNPDYLQYAMETSKSADQLLDLMRREHSGQTPKLYWGEKAQPLYETALEAAYLSGDTEAAFYFFERSKAVLLLDGLLQNDARALLPDSLVQRERALQKALQAKETDPQKMVKIQEERAAFLSLLQDKFSNYFAVRYAPNAYELDDFWKDFNQANQEAFLHIFTGKKATYALALHQGKSQLFQIDNLDEPLEKWLSFFTEREKITNAPDAFLQQGYTIYQTALEPIFSSISAKKWCIFPDGNYNFVPWDVLPSAFPKENSFKNNALLIYDYTVSNAYSAAILNKQKKVNTTAVNILGFAPFAQQQQGHFSQLKASQQELDNLSEQFSGQFFFDHEANLALLNQPIDANNILHLATHAQAFTDDRPPFIALHDTLLYLSDLYQREVPVELVLLSACQSNLGTLKTGEGVLSLARGYTYAGAKSIIASQWNTNDVTTADIIQSFYHYLQEGDTKSAALRKAKLDWLTKAKIEPQRSPFLWAGLTLIGSDTELKLAKKTVWGWYLLGGISFLLLGLFFKNKNKM